MSSFSRRESIEPAHAATTPAESAGSIGIGLQLGVLLVLLGWYGVSVGRGLDVKDYDDLVRTVLAKGWSASPFFFTGDMYWLPLPMIVRGIAIALAKTMGLADAQATLVVAHWVTIAYLWGIWRILVSILTMLGGGRMAVWVFSCAYLLNFGTFEFAASAMSEPDFLFWTVLSLSIAIGCEVKQNYSATRIALLGASLMFACLTRYEAWSVALLLAGMALFKSRGRLQPHRRWIGLVLPAVPIVVWIVASAVRIDDPFHFIKQEQSYIGSYGLAHDFAGCIKALLKLHLLLVPLMFLLGAWELWRRRREGAVQWLALTVLLLGAWAVYVMWTHHAATRFVWPVSVLMFAAGSMNLARLLPRLGAQPRFAAFVPLALLSLVYVPWIVNRQNPFILPELRQFARDVDRLSSEGNVLLLDRLTDEDVLFVQVYRALIDQERLVHCQWIGACDVVTPEQITAHDLRTVLGRTEPAGVAVIQPPLATSRFGWSAWRIDRAGRVESAPG